MTLLTAPRAIDVARGVHNGSVRCPVYCDKRPSVRPGIQVELDDPEVEHHFLKDVFRDLVGIDHTAARLAPGPYHKLTNAVSRVY